MILDRLERGEFYSSLNAGLDKAFAFLRGEQSAKLPDGRHEIDGDRVYAIVVRAEGRPREQAKLEAHRRYIDVQYVVAGQDQIGWKNLAACSNATGPYDAEGDAELFADVPAAWITLGPGDFAVLFPQDAHAPGCGAGSFHKVVVKVAVD